MQDWAATAYLLDLVLGRQCWDPYNEAVAGVAHGVSGGRTLTVAPMRRYVPPILSSRVREGSLLTSWLGLEASGNISSLVPVYSFMANLQIARAAKAPKLILPHAGMFS